MAFCTKCGNVIPENSKFCTSCGSPTAQPVAPQPAAPTVSSQPIAQPVAPQPSYQQPSYQQPNYQQPSYQQPNYQQPNYQQPNYQQPNYQQPGFSQGPMHGTPVDTNRSLIVYILLTAITCGIYGLVFLSKLAKDVNEMCKGDGKETHGLGMLILLSLITCGIYTYVWYYQVQERLHDAAQRYNVAVKEDGTTVLLWLIFGSMLCGIGQFYGMYIMFNSANIVGKAYNDRLYNNLG